MGRNETHMLIEYVVEVGKANGYDLGDLKTHLTCHYTMARHGLLFATES